MAAIFSHPLFQYVMVQITQHYKHMDEFLLSYYFSKIFSEFISNHINSETHLCQDPKNSQQKCAQISSKQSSKLVPTVVYSLAQMLSTLVNVLFVKQCISCKAMTTLSSMYIAYDD